LITDTLEKREISESKEDIRAEQRTVDISNRENEGVRGRKLKREIAIGRVRHA
jgi:hypothetical protein